MFTAHFPLIWNELPQNINPIAFSIGFFAIRWYSLMYLMAFATVFLLLKSRLRKNEFGKEKIDLEKLFLFLIPGLLLGGRLGHAIFYDLQNSLANPLQVFVPFENGTFTGFYGMSFHGGLAGAFLAGLIFCKKHKVNLAALVDFAIPAIPLGYFFGRIGNFLNGELFGRSTNSALGMFFPTDEQHLLRHPSQLYEALGEGLLLFLILWPLRNKKILRGKFFALFLILYGMVRFFLEFFRQPDPQLGLVILGFSMGQILSGLMVTVGLILLNSKIQIPNTQNK